MFDLNRVARLIRGMLLEPRPTWQAYLAENKGWIKTAEELTLPLIIGSTVLTFLLSFLSLGSFLSTAFLGISGLLFGIGGGFVAMIVSAFVFAFLAGVFGGRNDFDRAFAALSLAGVPACVSVLADIVPLIGWALSILLAIYTIVLSYKIAPDAVGVPKGKRTQHFVTWMLGQFVAIILVGFVLF